MMLKIAVTGNIGSGKTTVCKIFESLGISVYYADKEAKKFYVEENVANEVIRLFGEQVYDDHQQLRIAELSRFAFKDPDKLRKLNDIIHPLVLKDFQRWCERHEQEAYTAYESALLFESGFFKQFDRSILILSPVRIARQRVMKRDGSSAEEFEERRSRQMDEKQKIPLADHIIHNDGVQALIPQVMSVHEIYQGLNQ
ncbi:MAG TPA: dephospho-CoA kinase [Bacteroidales bacterium]|nr:dephospho-CoA kinase [Bacteroidales bacterium]